MDSLEEITCFELPSGELAAYGGSIVKIDSEWMRCPSCGADLPHQSAYCSKCGAPTSVKPRRCVSCGAEVPYQDASCNRCGARNERRVRYSLWRVGILTFLSFGLYYPYWMYVSWKHLAEEMPGKEFHPFGHAMTQFVPIYSLVVLYQHFRTIKEAQEQKRAESNLVPGLAVALGIFVSIFNITSIMTVIVWVSPLLTVVHSFISIVGLGFLVLWGQRNLNKYWGRAWPRLVRSAGTGLGEIVITAVGGLFTGLALLFVLANILLGPQSIPIDVGSAHRGTIESRTQVDDYRFAVRAGTQYTIRVSPTTLGLGGDPLEGAIVALWDSDGATILQVENAETPIVIRWTASSSGTRYVTIESDGVGLGDYVLRVDAR